MGVASWAPLIKMTIVKLISFGDLNFKKKSFCHKKYKMRPCSGVAAEGWLWDGAAAWALLMKIGNLRHFVI